MLSVSTVANLFLLICSAESLCSKEPCKFDGECQEKDDGFTCKCKLFRYGTTCEKGSNGTFPSKLPHRID